MLRPKQEPLQVVSSYKVHRAEALKLIRKGAWKFKLATNSVHLAMSYYNLAVGAASGAENQGAQWQLTAITCLILASKFLERDDLVPLIEDMLKSVVEQPSSDSFAHQKSESSRSKITYDQITKKEVQIVQLLNWNMHHVTFQQFIENYTC